MQLFGAKITCGVRNPRTGEVVHARDDKISFGIPGIKGGMVLRMSQRVDVCPLSHFTDRGCRRAMNL